MQLSLLPERLTIIQFLVSNKLTCKCLVTKKGK